MPKLSGISPRDAVRVFQKLGYRIARESGHIIMSNGKVRLVIPRHNPINAITMGGVAKTAGLTPEQFRELL
jgi:predicted RNA binding protein YcfA (HicA-like mRNA interferase family)